MFTKLSGFFSRIQNARQRDLTGELFKKGRALLTVNPEDKLLTKFAKRYLEVGIKGATVGGTIGTLFGSVVTMESSIQAGFDDYETNKNLSRGIVKTIEAGAQGISSYTYTGVMIGGAPITYPCLKFLQPLSLNKSTENSQAGDESESKKEDSFRP